MEKKRDLGRVRDLRKILITPLENFEYMPFSEAKNLSPKSDVATIHIYPILDRRRKPHNLMNLHESFYHQAYIFLEGDKVHYNYGHGRGSSTREIHNQMIDFFLQDKELRMRTITAIIVPYRGELASYYIRQGYAYANHDIGTNFDPKFYQKLAQTRIPFSQYLSGWTDTKVNQVIFKDKAEQKIIHLSTQYDLTDKRFNKMILEERLKHKND